MRGHLKKRGEGSWSYWLDLGRDSDGKRRQQTGTIKGTKKQAESELARLISQIESGGYVKPVAKMTVADFLRQWIRDYANVNTTPRTSERYHEIVEKHLIPSLGSIHVTKLQPQQIQGYYTTALESGRRNGKGGLSPLTVNKHHRVLFEALRYGVKHGILARNIAESVDPPRGERKEISPLTFEDVDKLLEAAKDTPYYAIFYAATHTGMSAASF